MQKILFRAYELIYTYGHTWALPKFQQGGIIFFLREGDYQKCLREGDYF